MNDKISDYVKERNAALLRPLEEFRVWAASIGLRHPDSSVVEISYHKLRTACVTLPMEARSLSKKWLLERGYSPEDDGDVPT